jgi:hypothetical protein
MGQERKSQAKACGHFGSLWAGVIALMLCASRVLAQTVGMPTGINPGSNAATAGNLGALAAANNLSDVASASTSRSNLGLGSAAVINTPVTVANGGTGTGSTLTGLVRGGSPLAAAELSGDATTSGSNAVTVVKVNGSSVPASANLLGSNSSSQVTAPTNLTLGEAAAPSGSSSNDVLYPDSTAHRWKMNNNNGGATNVIGASDGLNALAAASGTYSMGGNSLTGLTLLQTNTANPAGSGLLRDANNSTTVAARNAANGADIALLGSDGSNNVLLGNANANGFKWQNSAYTITPPTAAPTSSGQVWSSTTAGVGSWVSTEFEIGEGSNTFGNNTPYPTNTVIATHKAANAGHFTQLSCVNQTLNAGSCTAAPTVNVFDGTTNTGSTLTCSTTVQTKGTQSTTAQSQTFAAGDIIGIYVSTQGATCTAPIFIVTATAVEP